MYHKSYIRKISVILFIFVFMIMFSSAFSSDVKAQESQPVPVYTDETARPSREGFLHVQGSVLADQSGNPVQLRGVSTHGLTWYPDYVNADFIQAISDDWNCNFIRFAMYSGIYCSDEKQESLDLMIQGIDAAIEADMYVLVDWHILEDYDPNMHKAEAIEFFSGLSEKYGNIPNIIYEICNEPNGSTDWADVMRYSDELIPVIRKNAPDSVIVVGTPEYDRNLAGALLRPLDFENVMYVLHFYTATHHEGLRGELEAAVEAGLPVFISECGICEASGDGTIDFASAVEWFSYLKEKNISYAVWSLSDKDESSAFFQTGFQPKGVPRDDDLSLSGRWVRELIRGADPKTIPFEKDTVAKDRYAKIRSFLHDSMGPRGTAPVKDWGIFALCAVCLLALAEVILGLYRKNRAKTLHSYDDVIQNEASVKQKRYMLVSRIVLILASLATLIYLFWRIMYSLPLKYGVIASSASIILLIVELLGFAESMVMYQNLMNMKNHPLPHIGEEEYPEVDLFIATYNEPVDLLRRTVNGCKHIRYPDPEKVHIWICDDNRRKEMRELAEEMGAGYFDRPDNSGAKAGNLNAALARTNAPYVVTFDADMIPKSDFLYKTIPYFIDFEKRNSGLHLGLLQTPQCFYDPDVFQHALYSEKRAPNEQDFFYRTIEVSKTGSNSVIYGGSNTVIARKALQKIGGFYTGSITEDFATGLMIESAGFVSLAISEPLASGQTPHLYKDHIKQRVRWGRGVIATAKQLKIFTRKGLDLSQKINYWSSVIYWYSPIKNLIYILSPLLFAAFAVPVIACNWLELAVFWLPMYILQDICLRFVSKNAISLKWSGIYETSVMPHLLIPVIKETFGVSLTSFKVTDKSAKKERREKDLRSMMPFIILCVLSVIGILRVIWLFGFKHIVSMLVILFWLIRNLYFLVMALFLIDGRDSDAEVVRVKDAESVQVTVAHGKDKGRTYEGVTTLMTEHKLRVYLDEGEDLTTGIPVDVVIQTPLYRAELSGAVSNVHVSKQGNTRTQTIEILDFHDTWYDYLCILYDRVPTLPQSLSHDFGIIRHLWQNIACRVARTRI